uniref:Uncharacterized protein n=1 Tax=Physcomitrium patens TaxID=3218 RepID=A0A2K1J722_PHYPA|nr:hypothetical protein PHYPA_020431 [Physcomitrium patens]
MHRSIPREAFSPLHLLLPNQPCRRCGCCIILTPLLPCSVGLFVIVKVKAESPFEATLADGLRVPLGAPQCRTCANALQSRRFVQREQVIVCAPLARLSFYDRGCWSKLNKRLT